MRNSILAILILTISSGLAAAEEMCKVSGYEVLPINHPECLFNSGIYSFQNNQFQKASSYWEKLVELKGVPFEYEYLQVYALNNLGFVYFYGKGVAVDKQRAITYWSAATKAGNEESPYHLCYAYITPKEPAYSPEKALGYCKESLRRYKLLANRSNGVSQIIEELEGTISNHENR